MKNLVKALVTCALLQLAVSGAQAVGLEQRGAPESAVTTMSTYGMEVTTRSGLRAVVPAGWQLFIHKDANLPEAMSWKLGESWPSVLSELANEHKLSVLVDWQERAVLIRSPEVAYDELAKRNEINQSATTPLPSFADATSVKKTRSGKVKEVELPEFSNSGVIRTNPTAEMARRSEENQRKGTTQAPRANGEFAYADAMALNKPHARTVAQAIANKFGMKLMWAAPEFKLQGPVTLLAESAEQDVALLQKAMGVYSPVVLEVELSAKRIWAVPRAFAGQRLITPQLLAAAHASSATPLPPVVDGPQPVKVPGISGGPVRLVIGERMTLEDALVKLAKEQGYTLEWKVTGGFEAKKETRYEAPSISTLLAQVLPPLGVSADVYTRDKHIVVRPADAKLDK